jgi:E3 ubiquitin-protein ligase HUWE1
MFDENELELLFNGLPSIDLAEFKATVQYSSWRESDEVVRWFWAAVESFNKEELARLLQFITGSSQLPIGGFRAFTTPISINKVRRCAVPVG